MPRKPNYTLTPDQQKASDRYEQWCVGVKGYEVDTYGSYVRWFRWMLGHGFDWEAFKRSQNEAWEVGLAWCAYRRKTTGIPGYNHHVVVLNGLAEMLGYGIKFKTARIQERAGRPNSPEERAKAIKYNPKSQETKYRTLAAWHFSQETGARRGAVWRLHEQDLDPKKTRVRLVRPGKLGKMGWIPVRRSLWDPTLPFARWLSLRPRAEDDPGWIWTTARGTPRRIALNTLTSNLNELSKATGTRFNFVTGRYTAITETAAPPEGGGDLLVAKERARHARVETTMGYTRLPEEWVEARYHQIKRPPLVEKGREETDAE